MQQNWDENFTYEEWKCYFVMLWSNTITNDQKAFCMTGYFSSLNKFFHCGEGICETIFLKIDL